MEGSKIQEILTAALSKSYEQEEGAGASAAKKAETYLMKVLRIKKGQARSLVDELVAQGSGKGKSKAITTALSKLSASELERVGIAAGIAFRGRSNAEASERMHGPSLDAPNTEGGTLRQTIDTEGVSEVKNLTGSKRPPNKQELARSFSEGTGGKKASKGGTMRKKFRVDNRTLRQLVQMGVPEEALKSPEALGRFAAKLSGETGESLAVIAENWATSKDRLLTGEFAPLKVDISGKPGTVAPDPYDTGVLESEAKRRPVGMFGTAEDVEKDLEKSRALSEELTQKRSPGTAADRQARQAALAASREKERLRNARVEKLTDKGRTGKVLERIKGRLAEGRYAGPLQRSSQIADLNLGKEAQAKAAAEALDQEILQKSLSRYPKAFEQTVSKGNALIAETEAAEAKALERSLAKYAGEGSKYQKLMAAAADQKGWKGALRRFGGPLAIGLPIVMELVNQISRRGEASTALKAEDIAASGNLTASQMLERMRFSQHQASDPAGEQNALFQSILSNLATPPITTRGTYVGPHYGVDKVERSGLNMQEVLASLAGGA